MEGSAMSWGVMLNGIVNRNVQRKEDNMATTYDYQTRKIERDFHFVRWDEKCKLGGLPCYVGSERCTKCQYYNGSIHPFSFQIRFGYRLNDSYVFCKHPEKKDSENCSEAIHAFHEAFEHEALCAMDY